MIFNCILEIYLIQKNSMADGPTLVGGPSAGSDVGTSLQKVRMSERLYIVEGTKVRLSKPADRPPDMAGLSTVLFF